ncbi:MAG TPA: prolyl oligopeptidase family serine peptidase, partial [Minicystis sp.]|nr:prolyl oligopeptidase family serine peptidase [Minicystis sp.]
TVDVKDTIFGVEVKDPFRWLEDAKSPEVQQWMKDEDALARSYLAGLPERGAIAARLKELYYIESISAPRHRGNRFFYSRRHADKEKSIVYVKEGKAGAEKVLLDPNAWTADGSESLGGYWPSWDGRKVAFKIKKNNSDEATMYLLDVATGKRSAVDVIDGAKYAAASWTPSGDGFYYTWLPTDPKIGASERPGYAEVRFHKIGDDPKKDRIVHEKTGDATKFIEAYVSRDGKWLVTSIAEGWTANDVYVKEARDIKGPWRPLVAGVKAHFNVDVYKDRFYVHTDDGAPHYRAFVVDPKHVERAAWKEILHERADATLDEPEIFGGKLVTPYLKDASSRLEVHDLDGKLVREVKLPGIGSVAGLTGREDDDTFYWGFESFTTPLEIQSSSVKTGATELYARVKVPVDPAPYVVDQVFFPSKDGTRVSMFVVHRKDAKKDGSNRALLYGYGGFQISETPEFISTIYPWLERGGVYALANLRGGGEYGEAWHKAGMLLNKQNVFDDFIAAAEELVKEGWTKPERLTSWGGSNGGLLVGATLVQRPDLFGAALCGVPLLDMVRYDKFGSGKTWVAEYGSPENEQQFKALYAYSPYHHVVVGTRYPAVLLASADSDDRVDPMHARKFAAALQAASTGGPVILRIEKHSGHGGADLVKANVEKNADQLAFALANTK